jgi:hypothetical protein
MYEQLDISAYGLIPGPVHLSCIGNYWAYFQPGSALVSYGYGSFSGSFGTVKSKVDVFIEGVWAGVDTYWTANVWGC